MQLRRLLLKVMLWLLALSALTGVLAFLVAESWFVWRTTWTGVFAALAAGALIPLSLATDRPHLRTMGLVGMGLVIAEFILGVSLLWFSRVNWFNQFDEQVAFTMLFILLIGVPTLMLLVLAQVPALSVMGRTGAILAIVVFIGFEIATWSDLFVSWRVEQKYWLSAWSLTGYCAMVTALLAGITREDRRFDRWLGMACAVLGFVMALLVIWNDADSLKDHLVWITTLGVVLAHYRLVSVAPLRGLQTWVRWASVAALLICGILTDVFLIRDIHHLPEIELVGRGAGAAAIAASCATLALIVLAAINRRGQYTPSAGPIKAIKLHCPRCDKQQTLDLGKAACASCGLVIHTRIEIPECPACGYLLFGLTSDRCPECGTAVTSTVKEQTVQSQ